MTVFRPRVDPFGLPLPGRFPPRFSVDDFMLVKDAGGWNPGGVMKRKTGSKANHRR